MTNKYFNDRKYFLHRNRWLRTSHPHIQLSYDVWNFYLPYALIKEKEVIHHINKDSSDDRLINLQKMDENEHIRLHQKGKNNSNWKDGSSKNILEYNRNYSKYIKYKTLFSIYDSENHFMYEEVLKYNVKINTIYFTHRWGNY